MQRTYLHESLKLEELAVQIFKVLLEKVPEPVIKHDLDQNTESLLLWHLMKKKIKIVPVHILMIHFSYETNKHNNLLNNIPI